LGFDVIRWNAQSPQISDINLTVCQHSERVLASVIVIAHPDPIFREGLRAHLQANHLHIETRDDPQWHRNLALLIAPLELLTDHPKQCPVLALVHPNQVQASLFDRCNDFLRLPCDPLELRVRASNLLIQQDQRIPLREVVEIGDVRLDPNAQRTWFQGSELELTRREFELLETLMLNAGRVVHKDELLRIAWGEHFAGKVRTVDQHVLQVRHHLHDHAKGSKYILTVHGRGYMFVDQPRVSVSKKPVSKSLNGAVAR
jgi:DNA-binding winged helix-turn-helix (wHTH) protein